MGSRSIEEVFGIKGLDKGDKGIKGTAPFILDKMPDLLYS